jgi:hypothetical protein
VLVASAVLAVVGWIAGLRLASGTPKVVVTWPPFAIAGFGLVLGIWQRSWYGQSADTFYHLAAVRSLLASGRPMVTDPLYGTQLKSLDPTSGVWHTVLAVWARLTGLDVMAWIWPGATAVGGAITILAFWTLARAVGRTDRVAAVATIAFMVFGEGLDMRWYAYPNRLSLGVAFIALFAVVSLTLKRTWAAAVLAVVAGWSALAMHLASAEMAIAAALLLLVFQLVEMITARLRTGHWRWHTPASVFGVGAVVALLALPLLAPKVGVVQNSSLTQYASVFLRSELLQLPAGMAVVQPGAMLVTNRWSLLFSPWAILATTAIAIAAGLPAFRRGDERALAASAMCALPAVLLLDPPITGALVNLSPYLLSRVALLLPFTAFVGAAWCLGAAPEMKGRGRMLAVGLGVLVLVAAAAQGLRELGGVYYPKSQTSVWVTRQLDVRTTYGDRGLFAAWSTVGGTYPIVASDIGTSYYMIGILPIATVGVPIKHAPFAIEQVDGEARRVAMLALLATATPEPARRAIMERFGASYVLLNVRDAHRKATYESFVKQPASFVQVVKTPQMAMFRYRK